MIGDTGRSRLSTPWNSDNYVFRRKIGKKRGRTHLVFPKFYGFDLLKCSFYHPIDENFSEPKKILDPPMGKANATRVSVGRGTTKEYMGYTNMYPGYAFLTKHVPPSYKKGTWVTYAPKSY